MADHHPAVAAVLEASPQWDHLVFTGASPVQRHPGRLAPTWSPLDHPDAISTAAKQAAAVLRWAARYFGDMDGYYQYDQLRAIADEIEASHG